MSEIAKKEKHLYLSRYDFVLAFLTTLLRINNRVKTAEESGRSKIQNISVLFRK